MSRSLTICQVFMGEVQPFLLKTSVGCDAVDKKILVSTTKSATVIQYIYGAPFVKNYTGHI